ncbi:MAG TPA: ATP-binding protein [Gaiellaceae bacterium]|nr:ATP-binding protein [Gaiellaceae bacterium]
MTTPAASIRSTEPSNTGGARCVRLRIPARAEYITLGRLALTGLSRLQVLSDETLADLKLALTEACSNSVRHAYRDGRDGVVEIVYDLSPDRLVIEVSDDGPGFDYVETEGEEQALAEGGLGLAIIRSLADEFELDGRSATGGSRLRFVKNLR